MLGEYPFYSYGMLKKPNSFRCVRQSEPKQVQRSNSEESPLSQFHLSTFKTVQCSNPNDHNLKHCLYFHSKNDRRRNPDLYQYSCDLCAHQENCDLNCGYSHNKVEQLYHPNRYKTKYCQSRGNCEYGRYCSFAHNDSEILIPEKLHLEKPDSDFWMFAYKTVWCPYIQKHDRGSCVYAHNAQDFRRDPRAWEYEPTDCLEWKKSDNVTSYKQGGCPHMENCTKCHGWKEYEYHPLNYKTKKCSNGLSCKKRDRDCAYYHVEEERRYTLTTTYRVRKDEEKPKQIQKKEKVELPPYQIKNTNEKQRKQLIKPQSNFNGPIILKGTPIEEDSNKQIFRFEKRLQIKRDIGQPFEQFSSAISSTDSRKMSDISYGTCESTQFNISTNTIPTTQPKRVRTAPVTPDQMKNPPKPEMLQQALDKMTNEFTRKLSKKLPLGFISLIQVQEHQLTSAKSLDDLILTLPFLSEEKVKLIWNALEEIRIEDGDDDFIIQLTNQDIF